VSGDRPAEQAIREPGGEAAVEELRLQRGEGELAQEPIADARFAAKKGRAERGVVASPAEALRAEEVWRAAGAKRDGDPLRARERPGTAPAYDDPQTAPQQPPDRALDADPRPGVSRAAC